MEYLKIFLRRYQKIIFAFLVCFSIITLLLFLYRLPVKALFYPFLLCACFLLIFGVLDFAPIWQKHKWLESLDGKPSEAIDALPEPKTLEDSDYQRIIDGLLVEIKEVNTNDAAKYSGMIEYYTLWAHQIKTPIASMRLSLQSEDTPLSRKLVSDLLRIEQYVDMVMSYLRLESSSTDYLFRECDVDAVIRQTVAKLSSEFITRRIRLEYEPVGETLVTDEKWLSLVLEQVLSNALKYTNEGSVKIYKEEERLVVEDTGIGISPEDLPRVFEKGYTGYNGRYDKRASGIGLYLCRRICQNLALGIDITSELGVGTKVSLDLRQYELKPE